MKSPKAFRRKNRVLAGIAALLCAAILTACSSDLAGKLPGTYDRGGHPITFYSDGTYEESGKYGTGEWVILDNRTLKLTDFYGSTVTFEINGITEDGMEANGSVWERIH